MIAIRPLHAVAAYGRMIKFSHSVFALPFALSGAAMAATRSGVTLSQIGWIALAMVGGETLANQAFQVSADETKEIEFVVRAVFISDVSLTPHYRGESTELSFVAMTYSLNNMGVSGGGGAGHFESQQGQCSIR